MTTFVRTEQEQREIRMYGCTQAELRESIEDSITFKFAGPAMVVAGLMSDAQEHMAYDSSYKNSAELIRQTLNQAKWVLTTYVMKGE
jgi:uncharacterized protein YodC (DUF2158 family)